ncbi:MAG: hypothetical protein OXF47_04495 [Nitrospira sp.]|nr:hypothetical protein [Nitrospira sp.]
MDIEDYTKDSDDVIENSMAEVVVEQNKLRHSLDLLKKRLETDPSGVSQEDIFQGIRNCFDLEESSDFLDDTPWLIKALLFTSKPICNEEIPIAWAGFLNDIEISEEFIDLLDWPVLEGIAWWYFFYRNEAGYNEDDMVRRALAIFEHLIPFFYGHEEEYDKEIFPANGLNVFYGYFGLKYFERAKFYAQCLQIAYLADRLDSEDYHQVKKMYDYILKLENEDRESNNKILELQWQTLSDREKRIEELEKRLHQIIKQESNKVDLGKAEKELKEKFGSTWPALHAETRNQLVLATAFAHPSISNEYPYATPCFLFKALNSELSAKFFMPYGPLDKERLFNDQNGHSEVMLLINYGRDRFGMEPEINSLIEKALGVIGGRTHILTAQDLKYLDFLRKERNKAEHPKRLYTKDELQKLLRDVWYKNWLSEWLKRLNQTA